MIKSSSVHIIDLQVPIMSITKRTILLVQFTSYFQVKLRFYLWILEKKTKRSSLSKIASTDNSSWITCAIEELGQQGFVQIGFGHVLQGGWIMIHEITSAWP